MVARRDYSAMLAVDSTYNKRSIGSATVKMAMEAMRETVLTQELPEETWTVT